MKNKEIFSLGENKHTDNYEVILDLGNQEEIAEATKEYLARVAPRAAFSMAHALNDPTELGIRDKMAAAKDLLDRTGYSKTEKMEVQASGGVVLMPPKNE